MIIHNCSCHLVDIYHNPGIRNCKRRCEINPDCQTKQCLGTSSDIVFQEVASTTRLYHCLEVAGSWHQ